MPREDNAALVANFLDELWNKRNVAIVDELLADTYVDHTPSSSADDTEPQGSEALKRLFEALHRESDIQVSIEDQMAEGDKVMTRVTWKCTPKSDDPSTAPQATVMGVGVDRIDRGKIVEDWNTLDVLYRLLNLLERPVDIAGPPAGPTPLAKLAGSRTPPVHCDRHHPCQSGFVCILGICRRV